MRHYLFIRHVGYHFCRRVEKGWYNEQWLNPSTGQTASIPTSPTINEDLLIGICRQLGIPLPSTVAPRSSRARARGGRRNSPGSGADSRATSVSTSRGGAAAPRRGSSLVHGRPDHSPRARLRGCAG